MNMHRFFMRWRWLRDYEKSLNKRATVEQALLNVANGTASIPTSEQCREWAQQLGVPPNWRDQ